VLFRIVLKKRLSI